MRKTPECRNPQHPAGRSKSMEFLEEKNQAFVFACKACKEINGVLSVQITTSVAMKQEIRKNLERQGRLLTQPAPRIRTVGMNQELMRKMGRLK